MICKITALIYTIGTFGDVFGARDIFGRSRCISKARILMEMPDNVGIETRKMKNMREMRVAPGREIGGVIRRDD